MHKNMKKLLTCALAAVTCACMITGCGSAKIDGTQTLITVNGDSEDLGVGSFMAKYQQASIYKYWGQYFGAAGDMFDAVMDSSTNETYGDSMKDSVIEDLKLMLCLKQHMDEYNVSISDDEQKQIEDAAQAYIDNNSEEVRAKIGASKDDVIEVMTLQTIQSKMMDPLVADVDTNIDDKDVQQTSVTYVAVDIPDTSSSDSTDSTASADSTDSAGTSASDVASSISALSEAQAIWDAVSAESDVANADMNTIASGINEDYTAQTGHFTTNNPTDTTLDSAIVDSVSGLSDGTLVDHVVESSDGTAYYVVRLDKNYDEDATESERNSEIIQRKQDKYDEITEGWVDAAEVTVNDEAWATVVLTDSDPITLADSTASTAESTASSAESTASSAASSAETAASSTASSAASSAESASSSAGSSAA